MLGEESEKVSLRKWHLYKNLSDEKETHKQRSRQRAFQAEEITKALRREQWNLQE